MAFLWGFFELEVIVLSTFCPKGQRGSISVKNESAVPEGNETTGSYPPPVWHSSAPSVFNALALNSGQSNAFEKYHQTLI